MLNLQTPGVYIREVEVPQPRLLPMSVTGFVGQAERGPLNIPQRLENLGQFRDIFGDFVGHSYLPYSIFGFFLNGGERCYVVRVAHRSATCAHLQSGKSPLIHVRAINEGPWGNSITVQIERTSTRQIVLTSLEHEAKHNAVKTTLRSVAGLTDGDEVTLIHPRDPIQQTFTIAHINEHRREVIFKEKISSSFGFPIYSAVMGRGFRLIFRFTSAGKLVREEDFDNLSMNPDSPDYFVLRINGDPELADYVARQQNGNSILVRVQDRNLTHPHPDSRPAELPETKLQGGQDSPDKISVKYFSGYEQDSGEYFHALPSHATHTELEANRERLNGLAAFELIPEIGLIAVPDLIIPDLYKNIPAARVPASGIIFARPPSVALNPDQMPQFKAGQKELLKHCERMADRFAILDSPRGAETSRGRNRIEDWPNEYQLLSLARYGALYYPWIREKAADFKGIDLTLPPSGHLAGVFARAENRGTVGRAPANEPLLGVIELEFCLSDTEQAILNPRGVNCLRSFPSRGLLVWGARTLSQDPLWRYINVSRVVLATIKQILINLQWTVFEPNDRQLWGRIITELTFFLSDLFQMGVLQGNRPEEAFFVKCDDETNPPEVIERGEVITRVGLAPARPAEFLVVTIKRTSEAVSVSESLGGRR